VVHFRQIISKDDLAESTGLEPATSAVTGQRSNQLSYNSRPFFPAQQGGEDGIDFHEVCK